MAEVGRSVRRILSAGDLDTVDLVVRTKAPLETSMTRTVSAFQAEGRAARAAGGADFSANVAPSTSGPVVLVETWDLERRLPAMVAELDRAGIADARLEVFAGGAPKVCTAPRPAAFVEARVAVPGTRLHPAVGLPRWQPDPEAWTAALAAGIAWCAALPRPKVRTYLAAELGISEIPAARAARMVDLALRTAAANGEWSPVNLFAASGNAFRMLALFPDSAHVSFVDGTAVPAELDWETSLAAAVEPLTAAAAWAVRGFVKRGRQWDYAGYQTLTSDWIGPRSGQMRGVEERDIEEHALPDAFGVILLPAADRESLPPSWSTEGDGPVLARHPDAAAWYATDVPSIDLVTATRDNLGQLVQIPD